MVVCVLVCEYIFGCPCWSFFMRNRFALNNSVVLNLLWKCMLLIIFDENILRLIFVVYTTVLWKYLNLAIFMCEGCLIKHIVSFPGMDISLLDLINIQRFSARLVGLTRYRRELSEYLGSKMTSVAPSLTSLIGEQVRDCDGCVVNCAGCVVNCADLVPVHRVCYCQRMPCRYWIM